MHECAEPDACAARCNKALCTGRRQPLPLKFELDKALKQTTAVLDLLAGTAGTDRNSPNYSTGDANSGDSTQRA